MNDEEQNSLLKLRTEFNDVFHLEGDVSTSTNLVMHDIPTVNVNAPIISKTYRYPEIHKKEVDKQITKMLEDIYIFI